MASRKTNKDKIVHSLNRLARSVENKNKSAKLVEKQISLASDIRNLGNGSFIALVIGRAFSDNFTFRVFTFGLIFLLLTYYGAGLVERGGGKS